MRYIGIASYQCLHCLGELRIIPQRPSVDYATGCYVEHARIGPGYCPYEGHRFWVPCFVGHAVPVGANMQRQSVNSTRIKSIGFEPQSSTMEIEFQGSGRVYQYTGPKVREHYDGMMNANKNGESVGAYFNSNVRHCPDTQYVEIKEQPPEG